MPKPAAVEQNVRSWLHTERQDTLNAFVRVITMSVSTTASTNVSSSVSVADLRIPISALGRDITDMAGVGGHARALAV